MTSNPAWTLCADGMTPPRKTLSLAERRAREEGKRKREEEEKDRLERSHWLERFRAHWDRQRRELEARETQAREAQKRFLDSLPPGMYSRFAD